MTSEKKGNAPTDTYLKFFSGCGKVMNQVGLIGFIVIAIVSFIFLFASGSQKEDIINTWILFKNQDTLFPTIYTIIILITLLVVQWVYYSNKTKLMQARINELSKERTRLQEKLIGKPLHSSKTIQ